jgi:mannose-6-phosphate isomerase-like protein (cupin superfamily)
MERKQFMMTSAMALLASAGFAAAKTLKDNELKPFYIPPDDTPLEPVNGLGIRVKVRSHQTNNQYSCVDFAVGPRKMGPAPHVHKDLDELMYVRQGTVHVMVGTEVTEVKAGGWHFRPRGIVHTFWNASDEVALVTDMYFQQNFEDFLEELFHKIIPDMVQRKLTPASPEIAKKIEDLHRRFGITSFHEQRQPIIDKYKLVG